MAYNLDDFLAAPAVGAAPSAPVTPQADPVDAFLSEASPVAATLDRETALQKLVEDREGFNPEQYLGERISTGGALDPEDLTLAQEVYFRRGEQPMTAGRAAGAVGALGRGAVEAVGSFGRGLGTVASNTPDAIGLTAEGANQEKAQTKAMAIGQTGEVGAKGFMDRLFGPDSWWDRAMNVGQKLRIDDPEMTEDAPEEAIQGALNNQQAQEAAQNTPENRRLRSDRILQERADEAAKMLQLSQGRVLDEGAIAGLTGLAGVKPSEAVASPERLAESGVPWTPQDAQDVQDAGTVTDFTNLAPLHVPVAGALGRKAAGSAMEIVGEGLSRIGGGAAKLAERTAKSRIGSTAATAAAFTNPSAAGTALAGAGAAWAGGKTAQGVGNILRDMGKEARTGKPGAISTRLGESALKGERNLADKARRKVGDVLTETIAAPIAEAPINALISNDAEEFAEQTGGAAGFGAMAGAKRFRFRPEVAAGVTSFLQQEGARPTGDANLDAKHDAFMANADQDTRDSINGLRGFFGGMAGRSKGGAVTTNRIYVLSGPDFVAEARRLDPKMAEYSDAEIAMQRGVFLDGSGTALINGSNTQNATAAEAGHTAGHEGVGHAAENVMRLMTEQGHPLDSYLKESMRDGLFQVDGTPTPEFSKFIESYKQGAPEQIKNLDATDPYFANEFLAETAAQLLTEKGPGELALPKGIADRLIENVGNAWSRMLGMDPQELTGGTKFDRTQVGAINQAMGDLLGQLSGLKFRTHKLDPSKHSDIVPPAAGGADTPSGGKTPADGARGLHIEEGMSLARGSGKKSPSERERAAREAALGEEWDGMLNEFEAFAAANGIEIPTDPRELHQAVLAHSLGANQPKPKPQPAPAKPAPVAAQPSSQAQGDLADFGPQIPEDKRVATITDNGISEQRLVDQPKPIVRPVRGKQPAQPAAKEQPAQGDLSTVKPKVRMFRDPADGVWKERTVHTADGSATPDNPALAQEPKAGDLAPTMDREQQPKAESTTEPKTDATRKAEPAADKPKGPTKEEINERVAAAEAEVKDSDEYKRVSVSKRHKNPAKTLADMVAKARLSAILGAVHDAADSSDMLQLREEYGETKWTGRLDDTVPAHLRLLEEAGIVDRANLEKIDFLSANLGKTVFLDYHSAKKDVQSEVAGERGIDRTGKQRAEEMKRSQAGDRARSKKEGATDDLAEKSIEQDKAFVPLGFRVNPGKGTITATGFSVHKLLANAKKLIDFAKENNIRQGYADINDPQLAKDLQTCAQNHAHGYKGDGSGPLQGAGFTPDPNYTPGKIPKERFDLLNAAFKDERSTASARAAEKGGKVRGATSQKEAEAHELARQNQGFLDPQTGEVNEFRDAINKSGKFSFTNEATSETRRGTSEMLEDVIESLRPELIDNPRAEQPEHPASIRETGFKGDLADFAKEGLPNHKAVGAAFMPQSEERTKQIEKIARKSGIDYNGRLSKDGEMEVHQYTDPESGKSFPLAGNPTEEAIARKLKEVRGSRTSFMPEEGGDLANFEKTKSAKQAKIDEAARKAGYTIFAAHSTNSDEFHEFKTGGLSAHFGTEQAAGDRAKHLRDFSEGVVGREHKEARVIPVALKIENPLRMPDMASLTQTERGEFVSLEEARNEWMDSLSEEDLAAWKNPDGYEGDVQEEIQAEYGDYPRPLAWEGETEFQEWLRANDHITSDEFWDVQYDVDAAVELLKEKGYDGIVYRNDVEDAGQDSYIVFDPSQIKRRDVTSDDAGQEIPAEKRFDSKSNDIRFMPKEGGDLSNFEKNEEGKKSDMDPLGFYSGLRRVVDSKLPNRASAAQIRATLDPQKSGVRKEELDWMGLDAFLEGKETVSKKELLEFIDSNRVEMKEVVKSEDSGRKLSFEEWVAKQGYGPGAIEDFGPSLHRSYDAFRQGASGQEGGPKFSQYKLAGGTNYRETLLTIPEARTMDTIAKEMGFDGWVSSLTKDQKEEIQRRYEAQKFKRRDSFKSSHWDEPNVLAHLRTQDFTDSEGKKVRVIEEIQSDWAQLGRKNGYAGDKSVEKELKAFRKNHGIKEGSLDWMDEQPQSVQDEYFRLVERATEEQGKNITGVPDMPFKKTESWGGLAFKKALRDAVESGADKLAWVTGEIAADRFDISKSIDQIQWIVTNPKKSPDSGKLIAYKDGTRVIEQDTTADKLPDLIGKDVAEKIVNEKPITNSRGTNTHALSGLDLKTGGEGMKGFYDAIIPAFVKKYVKKWGGKVETVEVFSKSGHDEEAKVTYDSSDGERVEKIFETRAEAQEWVRGNRSAGSNFRILKAEVDKPVTLHSVTITDAMREGVRGGQALFMPSEAVPRKVLSNGAAADSKAFSDFRKSSAFQSHGLGQLSVDARGVMVRGMLRMAKDLEILDSVIELIPVDVVNDLGGKEATAKMLLKENSVIQQGLSGAVNDHVPAMVDVAGSIARMVAGAATKVPGATTDLGGYLEERGSALGADDGDFHRPIEPGESPKSSIASGHAGGDLSNFEKTKRTPSPKTGGGDLSQFMAYAGENARDFEEAERKGRVFRGKYDGKQRFEIDDSGAILKGTGTIGEIAEKRKQADRPLTLDDVMRHEKLFAQYPELRGIEFSTHKNGPRGEFRAGDVLDVDSRPSISLREDLARGEAVSTILHELQHWIQEREGFATGGSPSMFDGKEIPALADSINRDHRAAVEKIRASEPYKKRVKELESELPRIKSRRTSEELPDRAEASYRADEEFGILKMDEERERRVAKLLKSPAGDTFGDQRVNAYRRSAGEIEARDVQARKDLSDFERERTAPYSSEEVVREDAVVRFMPPDSKEFKEWFGESKVVDEKGEPLIASHGTASAGFAEFKMGKGRKNESLSFGAHFWKDRKLSERYAKEGDLARKGKNPAVYDVFLSIQNPLDVERAVYEGSPEFDLAKKIAGRSFFPIKGHDGKLGVYLKNAVESGSPVRAMKLIQEAGFDGVKYMGDIAEMTPYGKNVTGKGEAWIAFDPTQIKSATDNSGEFNPANPDIRFMPGEKLDQNHDLKAAKFYVGLTNPRISSGLTRDKDDSIARHNAKVEAMNILEENGALTDEAIYAIEGWNDADVEPLLRDVANDRRYLDEIERAHEDDEEDDSFETTKPLFDWVEAEHPETESIKLAGYVLPEGKMLSFSHDGRSRDQDHREVSWPGSAGGTEKMIAMMNAGAMRIDASSGNISLRRAPTGAQERAILKVAEKAGTAYIDAEVPSENGWDEKAKESFEVDEYSAEKALKKLRAFYRKHTFMPSDSGNFEKNEEGAKGDLNSFSRDLPRDPETGRFISPKDEVDKGDLSGFTPAK